MPRVTRTLAIDTECTGKDLRHSCRPFMVQTCDSKDCSEFWEWEVDPLTRKVRSSKKDLLEIQSAVDNADVLVFQNCRFDLTGLQLTFRDHGLEFHWDWSKIRDTLIAGHLLNSGQPHDLTTMAVIYIGVDIQSYEDDIETACREARQLVKQARLRLQKHSEESDIAHWRIAEEGLPEMPSAKSESKGNKAKGIVGSSPWKCDMWLPKLMAKKLEYSKDHPWHTVAQEYANADPITTLHLWKAQEQLLKDKGLWKIFLARMQMLPSVMAVEDAGITVSKSRVEELKQDYIETSARCKRTCIAVSGGEIEELPVNGVSNALKHVIFDEFKLVSPKKTKKGNVSLDKYVLDEWLISLPEHSKARTFIKNLKAYRKRQTALGFIKAYEKYWLPTNIEDFQVIYSSLNPTGTNTLRCSMSNPNGQQISKQEIAEEGEDGHNARYMFGPAPGREWWALDYENLELMLPAYESGEKIMIELFEKPNDPPYFGSYHLMNASIVYPDLFWPLAEQKGAFKKKYASTWYQWIKNFGFACAYGAIPESGTADRAAHKAGAQLAVMNRLTEHTKLNKKMIDLANKQGYVETMPDKTVDPKHGYPVYCSRSAWGKISQTLPLNYHIQSTAMWCTMKAMTRCHAQLQEWQKNGLDARMVLQVHDEVIYDFPLGGKNNLPKAKKLKQLMEQSGDDFGVPLRVAMSYHPNNWAEEEKVE